MQSQRDSDEKQEQTSPEGSEVFSQMQERVARGRRKASIGRLVAYILALIVVILLMVFLKSRGM